MTTETNAREETSDEKPDENGEGSAPVIGPRFSCDEAYPYDDKMNRKKYAKKLVKLQIELNKVQSWVRETGERIVIVVEGRGSGCVKRVARKFYAGTQH